MEKRDYLIILYDLYGELLNDKQQQYFEEYYFNNLSLGEISENLNISRNAVHKSLQSIEEKLQFYEEKLKLYKKSKIIYDIIEKESSQEIKKILKEMILEDEIHR
ncbi:MAG: sigma factor-like helix-turn-helix DNA-binding protein [Bacilli bacterium]|nr:sigma factor-like helix-turn-helix DNA-binding protein [Bacilli bacterium]